MITALRKIEGRGELQGATSAVMEMCVDNPRSGFADLFATHPSIDSRVDAIVKFAGGHDPGPLALPEPEEQAQVGADENMDQLAADRAMERIRRGADRRRQAVPAAAAADRARRSPSRRRRAGPVGTARARS